MQADITTETARCISTITPDNNIEAKASTNFIFDHDNINLESHQLVWLDANVNNSQHEDTIITLSNLRKIIDYTKLFDNIQECKQYLEQKENGFIFLVTSGSFGQSFIPDIHELNKIYKFYIYCSNKDWHQKWACNYLKIKERVHTKLHELLNNLKEDVEEYLKWEKAGVITNKTGTNEDRTTGSLDSWWIEFIKLICCLPYSKDQSQKLLDTLKYYYEGKEKELKVINKFENSYKPDQAIWWYTCDTFIYRLLNQGLRQYNIELILLFGFYIKDIYQQLNEQYKKFQSEYRDKSKIKLYRGQVMSMNEINSLKHRHEYNLYRNNCLLSTSLDRNVSLDFIRSSQEIEGLEKILFEIDIDFDKQSMPYGDVSKLSAFQNESEILFMIGAEFDMREGDVTYDENKQCWIIKCALLSSDSIELEIDENIKRSLQNSIRKFVDSYNAQYSFIYFKRIIDGLIHLFPLEKEWILPYIIYAQGKKYWPLEDSSVALGMSQYDEAINIWLKYLKDDELNCSIDSGNIHEIIARDYSSSTDNEYLSKKHYDLAITYFQSSFENTNNNITTWEKLYILDKLIYIYECKINMSDNEKEKLEYTTMVNKYREQRIQIMSNAGIDIDDIQSLIELGKLYETINQYDNALLTYEKAYNTALKNFAKSSYSMETIYEICNSMITIFLEQKKDYLSALKYRLIVHEQMMKIYLSKIWDDDSTLSYKISRMADSHCDLADIYILLNQYDLVKENLIAALGLYEESAEYGVEKAIEIAEKLVDIGMKLNENDFTNEYLNIELNLHNDAVELLEANLEKVRNKLSECEENLITETDSNTESDNNVLYFDQSDEEMGLFSIDSLKEDIVTIEAKIEEYTSKIKVIEEKLAICRF